MILEWFDNSLKEEWEEMLMKRQSTDHCYDLMFPNCGFSPEATEFGAVYINRRQKTRILLLCYQEWQNFYLHDHGSSSVKCGYSVLLFSCQVMSRLTPHGLLALWKPLSSLSPGVYQTLTCISQWCRSTMSSSGAPSPCFHSLSIRQGLF